MAGPGFESLILHQPEGLLPELTHLKSWLDWCCQLPIGILKIGPKQSLPHKSGQKALFWCEASTVIPGKKVKIHKTG